MNIAILNKAVTITMPLLAWIIVVILEWIGLGLFVAGLYFGIKKIIKYINRRK